MRFQGSKQNLAILDGTLNVSTYFIQLSNMFGQFNITSLTNQIAGVRPGLVRAAQPAISLFDS